jgi:hypothetical protein
MLNLRLVVGVTECVAIGFIQFQPRVSAVNTT